MSRTRRDKLKEEEAKKQILASMAAFKKKWGDSIQNKYRAGKGFWGFYHKDEQDTQE